MDSHYIAFNLHNTECGIERSFVQSKRYYTQVKKVVLGKELMLRLKEAHQGRNSTST